MLFAAPPPPTLDIDPATPVARRLLVAYALVRVATRAEGAASRCDTRRC